MPADQYRSTSPLILRPYSTLYYISSLERTITLAKMTMKDRFNRLCDMMLHHGKKDDTGAVKKEEEEKEVAAKVEAMIKGHAVGT
jgi:hypothetical protein